MIRLRHIQYFVTAAEQGSFRKAATLLNIQESAVSRRIRDLEDRLGASLFHRHSGGVSLTVAGQRFLRRVRIALHQIEVGINDVAAIGRSEDGIIKVGIFSSRQGSSSDCQSRSPDLMSKATIRGPSQR